MLILVKVFGILLGHVGSYWSCTKDFSKISNLLYKLLEKEDNFVFDGDCFKAFEFLTEKLVISPIIIYPYWFQPFKVIFDTSGG